jgi:hypothetical protein
LPALACAGGLDLESVSLDPPTLASLDAVAILTDHTAFDYAIVGAARRRHTKRCEAAARTRVPSRLAPTYGRRSRRQPTVRRDRTAYG